MPSCIHCAENVSRSEFKCRSHDQTECYNGGWMHVNGVATVASSLTCKCCAAVPWRAAIEVLV